MNGTVTPASLALIADIGGTNARFALTDLSAPAAQVLDARSLDASAFASLQHAAEHYLAAVGVQPRYAAIAVATITVTGKKQTRDAVIDAIWGPAPNQTTNNGISAIVGMV